MPVAEYEIESIDLDLDTEEDIPFGIIAYSDDFRPDGCFWGCCGNGAQIKVSSGGAC
ncbi:MAG: hypothetical protein ACYC27_04495 [Armatimonadota bacterium]